MHPHSLDLFSSVDTPDKSAPELLHIFESWAASLVGRNHRGTVRRESLAVYRDMWLALVRWCLAENVTLLTITALQLDEFLRSRRDPAELTDRYAWRVLRLTERVLKHYANALGIEPNTAVARLLSTRPEIGYSNASVKDQLPDCLDSAEARGLVLHLTTPPSPASTADWKDARNRCAVALHMGAGLTPAEVRALRFGAVFGMNSGTRRIRIPPSETGIEHDAPVARWAWKCIERWLTARTDHTFTADSGAFLLPATRAGRAWGKTAHYLAVSEVMRDAGVPSVGGAYRLRHTFALRQLCRGRDADEVAGWLGVDGKVMERYRWAMSSIVDVA